MSVTLERCFIMGLHSPSAGIRRLAFLFLCLGRLSMADVDHAEITGKTVNEKGEPVGGVRISLIRGHGSTTSRSDGVFTLATDRASYRYQTLLAASADAALMSFQDFNDADRIAVQQRAVITLVMKPCRTVRVLVKDAEGAPVAGASAGVETYTSILAKGVTDEGGVSVLRYPADVPIRHVMAVKSGAGLDYLDNSASKKWKDAKPLPDEVSLKLDGAMAVRVKATDSLGNPLSGIELLPWTIKKEDRGEYLNLGTEFDLQRLTDSEGIAVFDYLPPSTKDNVAFLCGSDDGWHLPEMPIWKVDGKPPPLLTARLLRNAKVKGVVLFPDGQPAPGILLQAEGRGNTNDYYRDTRRTRGDGSFEFNLYAEQSYIIAVTDEQWSAPSITGLVTHENTVRTDLAMTLSKGTLVTGQVKHFTTGAALPDVTITVVEQGAPIDGKQLGGNPEWLESEFAQLVRWTTTDAEGRYSIRLGKGFYEIGANNQKRADLEVGKEPGIVRDFEVAPRE